MHRGRFALLAPNTAPALFHRPPSRANGWLIWRAWPVCACKAMGVTRIYGNDSSAAWCTVTQSARFFPHRRDTALLGGSGCLAARIWRG